VRVLSIMLPLALVACARMESRAPAPAVPASSTTSAGATSVVPPARSTRSFHEFTPSMHGFQFRNGFQGAFLGTGESAYGLCGGMSFAAADYYLAGRDIPRDIRAPEQGTPLYDYIYSRQATSFGTLGAMGMKFVEWMQLPDHGTDSAYSRTMDEMPYIKSALSRGEPVVLGLVLVSTRDKGKAWDNHQVLALEASEPPSGGAEIRIYDSNFPGRDDITIAVELGRIVMQIPGRRGIPIRGMFRMAYTPVTPP
jgi:hypothetical protein